jgi:hypothetical protein
MKQEIIISIVTVAMIGMIVPIEFAEARLPTDACFQGDSQKNYWIKLSYDEQTKQHNCKKVNYWVPEKCGIIAGLYKTDPACQAPTGPTPEELQEQRERQEQRDREQRDREQEQKQYDREQEQKQYDREQEQKQYDREQEQKQYDREQEQKQYDREQESSSFFTNIMKSVTQFFNSLFPDSDAGKNNQGMSDAKYKEYLEYQRLTQDNPPIRYEQQYNPGKDQYLTEKYRMQDIPSNQRPWNP